MRGQEGGECPERQSGRDANFLSLRHSHSLAPMAALGSAQKSPSCGWRKASSIDAESRTVIAGGWKAMGMGTHCSMCIKLQFHKMKKF